uniref:Nuclear pore complex protein Nup88 n=1 Tax=Lygus hesperus TaxID=30085 RepID=A0A0A9X0F3_LYGHE
MPGEDSEFCFSHHKVLRDFTSRLPEDNTKCQGLITYGQDIFYLWDGADNEVHAVNVKRSLRDNIWDEEVVLRPKRQPLFEIERLSLNSSCTLLCLQGSEGVSVLHLPEAYEKESCIDLVCVSLAERLFQGEQHVLRCAKWHPGSPSDSHLVILTSDEVLRCYNTLNGQLLWSCILSKHAVVSNLNIPSRITLGDTPVNFDFVLPSVNDRDVSSVQWPILVLWGNGNIFRVLTDFSSEKPAVSGPLLMSPPSDDNYGSDASSLIVIPSTPPVVVMSTCSGTIYHSVLLTAEEGEEIENPNEVCLCVVESVELDLGLAVGDDDDIVPCPINLVADPVERSRYYCIHAGGIHSVTVPMVTKLYEFNEESGCDFSSFKTGSLVDYLLSTAVYSQSSYECSPLLGSVFVDLTMSLFVLLSNGKLVNVKVFPKTLYSIQNLIVEKLENGDGKGLQYVIDNYLKDGGITSQPTMKLPSTTSPQAWLELILRTSQQLGTVLKTHEKISFQLESRAAAAYRAIEEQKNDIMRLQEEKTCLQETAETIAEKYEEMNELMGSLNTRLENIMKNSYSGALGLTQKEKNAAESFQSLEKKIQRFEHDLKRIRATYEYQNSTSRETTKALNSNMAFYIDDSKSRSIRKQLKESSNELLSLHRRIEDMKDIMINEGLIK